jgi:limonene-1,2-epoxide hydrolase
MSRTPAALVTDFLSLWSELDAEALAACCTEDAVCITSGETVFGRDAITRFVVNLATRYEGIDTTVHRQIGNGNVVMNERTDVLRTRGGNRFQLPVMGVFEIAGGRIAGWRNYFDLNGARGHAHRAELLYFEGQSRSAEVLLSEAIDCDAAE